MDVKQELKNQFAAQRIAAIMSLIVCLFIPVLALHNIPRGIEHVKRSDWIIAGAGVVLMVFELYRLREIRKKKRELEQAGPVRPDGALPRETSESLAPESDIELVTVASYTNEAIAEIAKERLIASGIDAMIDGTVSFYPDFNQMYPIELKVRKEDLAAASELLASKDDELSAEK